MHAAAEVQCNELKVRYHEVHRTRMRATLGAAQTIPGPELAKRPRIHLRHGQIPGDTPTHCINRDVLDPGQSELDFSQAEHAAYKQSSLQPQGPCSVPRDEG